MPHKCMCSQLDSAGQYFIHLLSKPARRGLQLTVLNRGEMYCKLLSLGSAISEAPAMRNHLLIQENKCPWASELVHFCSFLLPTLASVLLQEAPKILETSA